MENKPFISREEGAKARQKKRNQAVITAEVVTLDVEQIITATVARFNEVPKTDYKAIAAPYRELDPVALSDPQLLKEVEEARKKLKNDRVMIERLRKELKEDSLKTGKAIDAKAKELTEPITEPEQYLEDLVERFKKHEAEQERLRAEALKRVIAGRISALAQYGHIITYDEVIVLEELDFQELLQEKKAEFEMAQAVKDAEEKRKAQEAKAQEEKLKEFEQKERELFKKQLKLIIHQFMALKNAPPILVVPDEIPIDVVREICNTGFDDGNSEIPWVYEKDYTEPVLIGELVEAPENQSGETPLNWLTEELNQIPPLPPVQVKNDVPAEHANTLYGERYGIDWVYEEQSKPVATPDDEKPVSNANNLPDDFFEALDNVTSIKSVLDHNTYMDMDAGILSHYIEQVCKVTKPKMLSKRGHHFMLTFDKVIGVFIRDIASDESNLDFSPDNLIG